MRLNRLDLNLLVVLDALLSECSITRAAERINLSQPATSGALARLRDYFDDPLLVRVGASMQPTPLGEALKKPISNILMEIQATVEKRPRFDPQTSDRRFRLLLSDYTGSELMPAVIARVARLAPGVQFELIPPTDDPLALLDQGHVDFLVMPGHILSDRHPITPIFSEPFVCMAWADSAIAAGQLTVERYLKAGHVTVQFGVRRVGTQDQILLKQDHGIEPRVEVIAATFSAVPQYLIGTERIATTYRRLAEKWARFLPLKVMPLPVALPEVTWSVQWHQYRDLDPGIQWMREQIVTAIRGEEVNGGAI